MPGSAYTVGRLQALATYGVKLAFDMEDFTENVQRQAIGDPAGVAKQLRKGTFFRPDKGLFFKSLPKTVESGMSQLSWPMLGTFLQMRNDPDASTSELMGDFSGRAVGSLLGSSLGAAGQLGGSLLLGPVGRAIGRAVGDSRSSVVPET